VTCGDFYDGSEKGTASVHQILCQSWEKCYGDLHSDSTSLRKPKLESCAGVPMACPVQDRSHIRIDIGPFTTLLRRCKLVMDMPTGSDGRTGHAPCRSQICAQDPDS